jgi:nucleotide-binding universal stress UspA family protein
MLRPVIVGLDGSPESLAAAHWAAREAILRGLPLHLVNAWFWQPHDVPDAQDTEAHKHWSTRHLREARADLTARHPLLPVTTEQVSDLAAPALLDRAAQAELLVLGSRGHSAVAGFLLGSVGMQVLAHAQSPVVMVRADEPAMADRTGGEVVVALQGLGTPAAPLLEFAFAAAAARGATLRAVHAWSLPPAYGYDAAVLRTADEDGGVASRQERALADALRPWREKFPQVPVAEQAEQGYAGEVVLRAAAGAGLAVVGRRVHRPALGMRIGPVTHAVLHHVPAPVAVVPHD